MATRKISMLYDLKQLNNANNNAHLLWFPKAKVTSVLSLRGLAEHITNHGTVWTNDIVEGVLTKFSNCLVELIAQGVAVKLDGLGKFYPSFEAKGAESPVGYNIDDYLKGVHVRFRPEGVAEENITSRVMKGKCMYSQNMIFDKNGMPKKIVDGQLVDYTSDDDDDNNEGGGTNENGGNG